LSCQRSKLALTRGSKYLVERMPTSWRGAKWARGMRERPALDSNMAHMLNVSRGCRAECGPQE